jgi:hypothetical protein
VLHHDWSLVIVGGVLSMLGGLSFIAATMWESRKTMGATAPTEAKSREVHRFNTGEQDIYQDKGGNHV